VKRTVDPDPKYSGTHSCPGCGGTSQWICVKQSPRVIRVVCAAGCGTFEAAYAELQTFPFFDKPSQKLAFQ
jgi:hypothetical protein